jgi:hypothetical protein
MQSLHPIERWKVLARVAQDLRIGWMIGVLDGNDRLCQLRMLVAQVDRKLMFCLRRTNQQDLVRTRNRLRDFLEKVMVGGGFVAPVGAFAAVHTLVLVIGVNVGVFLRRRREVPSGRLLMIYPNNRMIVWHL